ncbi:MAG: phosphotransferase [Microthrixaceae bacterium]|nr:phosphotransferase [Microthrixaceae bacterium]MCB1011955.1 phosphotransferase [Microthrixaceae bacterium]MCB9387781.1 phosphotransferase [Microthrixaceae bacterium]
MHPADDPAGAGALRAEVARARLDASSVFAGSPSGSAEATSVLRADDVPFRVDPERTATILGSALGALHAITVANPADPELRHHTMAHSVEVASEINAAASGQALDAAYAHIPRERLVAILRDGAEDLGEPNDADLVVTHGSPTLAELVCVDGRPVGFVGWEGLALADRHRDLAAAATSVASTLGPMAVPVFFDAYRRHPDPLRLDWWVLARHLGRQRLAEPGNSGGA